MEKWIVDRNEINFSKPSLKGYVYDCIESFNYGYNDSMSIIDKINHSKRIIYNSRMYEDEGHPEKAKNEIIKLFPEF
ncbi:hypothetical protein [Bacillus sp. THAF10]|uniref:hypothetical protein n=1 Tax=Bacillus sp. THAF10 TaxID=2587848 RepID=UPI0020A62DB4|nr:hypothetical protein [Bacillus sp. THAF10]